MENLNQKQSEILLKVLDGKNAFITGFAGSGKSYLIEHICELLKKKNKNYAKTAMTGCAALLINGKTLHSTLGIGLAKGEPKDLIKRIRRTEGKLEYLLRLNTLIIDEVSMLNDTLFDKIAEIFKILHSSDVPFGKLQIILIGDMSQLKPVEDEYCFYANCWDACKIEVSVLTENMRVNEDTLFHNLLQYIRWGKIDKNGLELIEKMKLNEFTGDIKPTKLFSRNRDVDNLNQREFNLILSDADEFISRIKLSLSKSRSEPNIISSSFSVLKLSLLSNNFQFSKTLSLKRSLSASEYISNKSHCCIFFEEDFSEISHSLMPIKTHLPHSTILSRLPLPVNLPLI